MEKYIRKHFLSLKIDYYKGIKSADTYADKYVDWCEKVLTDSIKKLNKNIAINVCGYIGSVEESIELKLEKALSSLVMMIRGGQLRDKYTTTIGRQQALDRSMKNAPTSDDNKK